jgi:tRNA G18 (ribose-2'-O)-methylase SpoU
MPFQHQRHKQPKTLQRPRELLLVCPPLRSSVNLSRIVRAASCFGLKRVIACGNPKVDSRIARDGAEQVEIEVRRSLPPVIDRLRQDGFQLVGLEQASESECLFEFEFHRRTAIVLGSEREGLDDPLLASMDRVAEIPVYGLPYSFNVATAAVMVMYEYCRQFPLG